MPTDRPRIRGLQDVMHGPERSKLGVLNKLTQLERERERITQEKQNWQAKVALIDVRLEEIAALEKKLQPCLAMEESIDDAPTDPEQKSGEVRRHWERAPAETVTTVALRY